MKNIKYEFFVLILIISANKKSGLNLRSYYVFWLAKYEFKFRKAPSPANFSMKIDILPLLCIMVTMYLYLPNMILISIKIHNPQVLKKSSLKAPKTTKNRFHVIKSIRPEICTLKSTYFSVLRFAGYNHAAAESLDPTNSAKLVYESSTKPKNSLKTRKSFNFV